MATLPPIDPTAPRLFLDTNVIYAGIASRKGASFAILLLSELGLLRPIVCPYVMDEVERNIRENLPEAVNRYEQVRASINWEFVDDPSKAAVEQWVGVIIPKDAPVLAAAVQAKPHRFITLDAKDFLKNAQVMTQSGLNIFTPGDLLREIRSILAIGFSST